jgi:hypothetical protein
MVIIVLLIAIFLPYRAIAQPTPVEKKVGVLITAWGLTDGYDFGYAWNLAWNSIGDKTEYEGQPCKAEFHLGPFPFQSHMNIQPFHILHEVEGREYAYDSSGIYRYDEGTDTYISIKPDHPSVPAADIPAEVPIVPLKDVLDNNDNPSYPLDPNTGEDHVAGWYKIGDYEDPSRYFPNGLHDFNEAYPARFIRNFGVSGGPTDPVEAAKLPPEILESEHTTQSLLETAFGDRIDVRHGYYGEIPGVTKHMADVAEEFGEEGFTKLLLARETTDNNRFANVIATGNYCKERLCEIGVLDDMTIFQTRQVGRTPEFNTMNVINMRPFIESYPKGSTIGVLYVTRGLPFASETVEPAFYGRYHPWSKEVYHDNAYLNYLSFKKAFIKAFGDDYNLVFNRGAADNDLREDNFYSYSMDWKEPFNTTREAVQMAKAEGLDKLIVIPTHWQYDNLDTFLHTRERNGLKVNPKSDLEADIFHLTYCEDAAENEVECSNPDAVAEILLAPAFSAVPEEFGIAYYVRLLGGLERFGLYPEDVQLGDSVTDPITKLNGGTVEITDPGSDIYGAQIVIPADPHPDWPETFTPDTAIPIDDPTDPSDCMWEDADITVAHRTNPPAMTDSIPVGPAVHFGPYRTIFNQDVTITVPCEDSLPAGQTVGVAIYNHITEDWDLIDPESVVDTANKLVVFKTQVLGLFQAVAVESGCPVEQIYGTHSEEVALLRAFRDTILSKTPAGQRVIKIYYDWSPAITEAVAKDKAFKEEIKRMIDPVVGLIERRME